MWPAVAQRVRGCQQITGCGAHVVPHVVHAVHLVLDMMYTWLSGYVAHDLLSPPPPYLAPNAPSRLTLLGHPLAWLVQAARTSCAGRYRRRICCAPPGGRSAAPPPAAPPPAAAAAAAAAAGVQNKRPWWGSWELISYHCRAEQQGSVGGRASRHYRLGGLTCPP